MKKNVLILSGDGVGPEVMQQAKNILARVAGDEINISHAVIGGVAIDNDDKPLPDKTLQAALECDAVLWGRSAPRNMILCPLLKSRRKDY